MEKSHNTEPTPDLYYYGRKYSELLDRLEQARKKFLEEKSEPDLTEKEKRDLILEFETKIIEQILVKLNDKNYPWLGHSMDNSSSKMIEATGDTFIDTKDRTIYRAESTNYSEDAPVQVEVGRFYSLDSLGKIQVATTSESEDLDDALESDLDPYSYDIEDKSSLENTQLDLEHAKRFSLMLQEIVESLEEEYKDRNNYIMLNSFYEDTDNTQPKYLIEKI